MKETEVLVIRLKYPYNDQVKGLRLKIFDDSCIVQFRTVMKNIINIEKKLAKRVATNKDGAQKLGLHPKDNGKEVIEVITSG